MKIKLLTGHVVNNQESRHNETCPERDKYPVETNSNFPSLALTFDPKIKGCSSDHGQHVSLKYHHCRSKENRVIDLLFGNNANFNPNLTLTFDLLPPKSIEVLLWS